MSVCVGSWHKKNDQVTRSHKTVPAKADTTTKALSNVRDLGTTCFKSRATRRFLPLHQLGVFPKAENRRNRLLMCVCVGSRQKRMIRLPEES